MKKILQFTRLWLVHSKILGLTLECVKKTVIVLLVFVFMSGLVRAACPEGNAVALLVQGSNNEHYWRAQNELVKTLLLNGFRQENIHALSFTPFTYTERVLLPSPEQLFDTLDMLAKNTQCADEVIIDIAADAVPLWTATLQFWDKSKTQQKEFIGKPFAQTQQKDYTSCYSSTGIIHLPECQELVIHHRDVPDGYRVLDAVQTGWCFMLSGTCVRAEELAEHINKLPACTKKVIAATSYARILDKFLGDDIEFYAAAQENEPAAPEFHHSFVAALFRTKMNFFDSFGQAKAAVHAISSTNPFIRFSRETCTCDCPRKEQQIIESIQQPTMLAVKEITLAQEKPVVKAAPKKLSIMVRKIQESPVMRQAPQTGCLAQCANIPVPAPRTAIVFTSEILAADTPFQCRQKTRFATVLNKEPCTNYYIASRDISKKVGFGTEFACCCRRIAKETLPKCTHDEFLGWTDEGLGVTTKDPEQADIIFSSSVASGLLHTRK